MSSEPTDKEIKNAATELLKECDLSSMTLKSIRVELEKKFDCNLSEKKEVIREALEKFLAKNEDEVYEKHLKNEQISSSDDVAAEDIKPKKKSAFGADVQLSEELGSFLGSYVMPRTEVTKRIWAYIKENNLQNPNDKREILCDVALEKVLKRKTVHMFKMTKILSAVIYCTVAYQINVKQLTV
jgi:upstream activation factor subunit UAF30